jgi:hypothetical protein
MNILKQTFQSFQCWCFIGSKYVKAHGRINSEWNKFLFEKVWSNVKYFVLDKIEDIFYMQQL